MIPRERILRALSRQKPDRIPFAFEFSPALFKIFQEKEKTTLWELEYYDFDLRIVNIKPTNKKIDWKKYYKDKDLPEETEFNEFGIADVPGSGKESYHFKHKVSPLSNVNSLKEIEEYPFPDIMEDYRWISVDEEVKKIHEKGYASVATGGTFFEWSWALRGYEQTLDDFASNGEITGVIMEKISELVYFTSKKLSKAKVDIIRFGDDIGMQDRMIISPDMWRKWIKPKFKEAIRICKDINPEVLIFYHSDGYIEPVIPDLIEIGVDILNPVQPECMDPEKLKMLYGDKLSFWGTIGTQTTMPFSSPGEIKEIVKRRIEIVGKGGGLLIAPTHILEPEVPWENVCAFIEAVRV